MGSANNLPDFLVLGAARAGTTALYEALSAHPDICLTRTKETNFFAYRDQTLRVRGPGAEFINNSITSLEEYLTEFPREKNGKLFGEVCPLYLFEPATPQNISDLAPDARLAVMLRNPVEQAWSHFLYARYNAIEPESDFVKALALEDERMAAGWQPLFGYSRFPRYGEQLARFFRLFPREQILVLDYSDFRKSAVEELKKLAGFVGAGTDFQVELGNKVNASDVPRYETLQNLIMRPSLLTAAGRILPVAWRRGLRDMIANVNRAERPDMPREAKNILRERLRDDVDVLSDLLGRNYRHWLADS